MRDKMKRKGMGMVGQIMLFTMGVMLFTGNMILMNASGDQNVFDQQVSREIEFQLASIKMNSVMTVMLEDHLWRAEQINYEKYGNMKFKKLASLYFSTEGDTVYVGRNSYDANGEDSVRNDIENYIEFKMDRYWRNTPYPTNYTVQIRSTGDREPINVGPGFEGTGSQRSYTLPRTSGEEVFVIVSVAERAGIFGVEPGEE
jgi:hypothetical protein